jgi:hypothetical protein
MDLNTNPQACRCLLSQYIVPSCISKYSREAEDALLPYFKKLSLQPDTAFFNQLIKTRALRKEPERGIATLDLMREWGAAPDILTFGCLALCCTSYKEAARLMADLKARGCLRNHAK